MNILSTVVNTTKALPAKAKMTIIKNAPVLCLGAGVAGVIGGVVLACKATRKSDAVINEFHEYETYCEGLVGKPCSDGTTYSEEDKNNDIKNEKIKTGVKVAKNYILAVLIIAASIGFICGGYKIKSNRAARLASTLNAVLIGEKAYRQRVASVIGDEAERELYYGKHTEVDEEGNTIVTYEVPKTGLAYVFDDSNVNFGRSNTMNAKWLCNIYQQLYRRYETIGHIFIIDILKELGDHEEDINFSDLRCAKTWGWKKGVTDDMDWGVVFDEFIERAKSNEFDNMDAISVILDFGSARDLLVNDRVWDTGDKMTVLY